MQHAPIATASTNQRPPLAKIRCKIFLTSLGATAWRGDRLASDRLSAGGYTFRPANAVAQRAAAGEAECPSAARQGYCTACGLTVLGAHSPGQNGKEGSRRGGSGGRFVEPATQHREIAPFKTFTNNTGETPLKKVIKKGSDERINA